jgi:hypothetical protein
VRITGNHAGTVFVADGLATPAVVEGITVMDGIGGSGGGLRLLHSHVVLRRCVITGNVASERGGGLFASGGYLRCEDCVFVDNAQSPQRSNGGAMAFWGGAAADLVNCTVVGNTPDGATTMFGSVVDATRCILEASTGLTSHCCWTADPLFCGAPADLRLSSSSPCLPGVTCLGLVGALGLGCGASPEERTYVVTTDPAGLPVTVDGETSGAPVTVTWTQYTEHSVEAPASVTGTAGSQWRFREWSDGDDIAHRMWAARDPYTWIAGYDLQHYLTVGAETGGSASPESGWHGAGDGVTVTALPDLGYVFDRWEGTGEGSYSGLANPAVVSMSGPVSEVAHFAPIAYEFSVSSSDIDPHLNAAGCVDGVRSLYLWLSCSRGGLAAFEADVTGTLPVLSFEGLGGVLNAGTCTHLLLAVPGCPAGDGVDYLMGRWLVMDGWPGGTLCLGRDDDSGDPPALAAVDCGTLQPFCARFPGVTGFSSSTASPCRREGQSCWAGGLPGPSTDARTPPAGPLATTLLPNTPNPFSGSTRLHFTLAARGRTTLRLYDVGGRLVRVFLAGDDAMAGPHELSWDGRDSDDRVVTDGVYFLRLESGPCAATRKILRVRE